MILPNSGVAKKILVAVMSLLLGVTIAVDL